MLIARAVKANWKTAFSGLIALGILLPLMHVLLSDSLAGPKTKEAFAAEIVSAPDVVSHIFGAWKGTTVDSEEGKAIAWSGSGSRVMYVSCLPGGVSHRGLTFPAGCDVWARSEGGKYFVVEFVREDTGTWKDLSVKTVLRANLLETLVRDHQEDLIQKLGLPLEKG